MTPAQLAPWLSLAAAILAAGMWLGRLDGRVTAVENEQRFLHGSFAVPKDIGR